MITSKGLCPYLTTNIEQLILKVNFLLDFFLLMSKINCLAEVFKQKGVRNNDIVKLLRVRKETVSRWVHNKQQPDLQKLYLIAEYLRVDIRDLLCPSDWSKSRVVPFEPKRDS